MANYEATARTNYFTVKDRAAFNMWFDELVGVSGTQRTKDPAIPEMICIVFDESLPDDRVFHMDDTDEENPVDFWAELSEHLITGEVCVAQEVGHEKMRYVSGHSIAVNHEGKILTVNINDIYSKIKEEWKTENVSDCSY